MTGDNAANDDLARLDRDLADEHLEGYWRLDMGAFKPEPTPLAPAHLWRWARIRELLTRAGELPTLQSATPRRTVRLCTPGMPIKWATPTIHASVQLVKPGEIAEAHRHRMAAFRFVVEGRGGFTTIEGEKFAMEANDLVLTPPWTWHDHGHDDGEPTIWIDGHDYPLLGHLNGLFQERFRQPRQDVVHSSGHYATRAGAMRPHNLPSGDWRLPYVYKGAEALTLLHSLGEDSRDDYAGVKLDYLDPLTSGPTMPTIMCRLHRLDAGHATKRHRRTSYQIFHAVEGEGVTHAGERDLAWREGDIFVMPAWTNYHHVSARGAVLFSASDEPIHKALDLFRIRDAD